MVAAVPARKTCLVLHSLITAEELTVDAEPALLLCLTTTADQSKVSRPGTMLGVKWQALSLKPS